MKTLEVTHLKVALPQHLVDALDAWCRWQQQQQGRTWVRNDAIEQLLTRTLADSGCDEARKLLEG